MKVPSLSTRKGRVLILLRGEKSQELGKLRRRQTNSFKGKAAAAGMAEKSRGPQGHKEIFFPQESSSGGCLRRPDQNTTTVPRPFLLKRRQTTTGDDLVVCATKMVVAVVLCGSKFGLEACGGPSEVKEDDVVWCEGGRRCRA